MLFHTTVIYFDNSILSISSNFTSNIEKISILNFNNDISIFSRKISIYRYVTLQIDISVWKHSIDIKSKYRYFEKMHFNNGYISACVNILTNCDMINVWYHRYCAMHWSRFPLKRLHQGYNGRFYRVEINYFSKISIFIKIHSITMR